jgi:hypothetical protein
MRTIILLVALLLTIAIVTSFRVHDITKNTDPTTKRHRRYFDATRVSSDASPGPTGPKKPVCKCNRPPCKCDKSEGRPTKDKFFALSESQAQQDVPSVLGTPLNENQFKWIQYIAQSVVPRMTQYYGDRDTALTNAAFVGWWALKEGVLDQNNAIRFSLCDPGKTRISNQWDGYCAREKGHGTWQVGLGAIQAPVDRDRANALIPELENICRRNGVEPADALVQVANDAGFGDVAAQIRDSPGRVKSAWLLRVPFIAFVRQGPQVQRECFNDAPKKWCATDAWYPSNKFAPNFQSIQPAYDEVRNLLFSLSEIPA